MKQLSKRETTYRTLSRWFGAVYALIGIVTGIYNIFASTPYYVMLAFASILFLFLPALFYKLLRLEPIYALNFAVYLFCFIAFMIGMVFNAYHLVPYYDKFAHTLSGVFFGLLGIVFYYLLKPRKQIEKADCGAAAYSAVTFALSTAVIWEIIEYALSYLLGNDCQNVLTTGVNDTMQDMIVCLVGALVFLIPLLLYYLKGRKGLLMGIFEEFFNRNLKK